MAAENTFQIWHGSRRWDGDPEIQAAKKGRAEWGAGIYGSTHFETCTGYAKGGGKVQLLTIQNTRVLEKSCLPLEVVIDYIKRFVPKPLRATLIGDCEDIAENVKDMVLINRDPVGPQTEGTTWLPADILRNLIVNFDLSSGVRGVNLARFYAEQGIGVSLDKGGSQTGEKWLVVYDPQLIVSWKGHTYESALDIGHILPEPDAHTTEPVIYLRPASRYSSFSMDR
ncbi:hypothetical protein V0M98_35515 (plasmid) [Pseudomonas silesiensis]|uniref:hypothetical protein n=1 Tax=Pseudomonas silesiensis TaxID=1853130 RepID=UPI0030D530B4